MVQESLAASGLETQVLGGLDENERVIVYLSDRIRDIVRIIGR